MSFKKTYLGFWLSIFLLFGCSGDSSVSPSGNWIKKSDFEGIPRNNALSFVINGKAYVGLGYNYNNDEYLKDFWEYDPTLNNWKRVADFPAAGRTGAVAFAAGGKGYVGTGYDGKDKLKDFWQYDPQNNQWQQKTDFGGTARRGALAFALNDLGYVGTGNDDNDLKDFWQYDPQSDTWAQIVSLGGGKRVNAFAFVLDGKAYVGGGKNNGAYEKDFWQYDPDLANWIRKEDLNTTSYTLAREGTVAFALNEKAYLSTGSTGAALKDSWEYNPVTDAWSKKTEFEGVARTEAVGFVLGNLAYICTGRNSLERYDDLWAFDPTADYNEND